MKQFSFQQILTNHERFLTNIHLAFKIPILKKLTLFYVLLTFFLFGVQFSFGVKQINFEILLLLLVPIGLLIIIVLVTWLIIVIRPKVKLEFEVNEEGIHYNYLNNRSSFSWFEVTGFQKKKNYYSFTINKNPLFVIPILKRSVQDVYDITDFEEFIKKNYTH